ncbi:hypothetical protein HOLleu_24271 [Holothuria leucospilota]|uniref:Uncharacterized protein n=1 Tax=Holothuria leucospilota TaxID=206669 RepID=A0A9Q1BW87_HOLLE|nr:hypothetical protein HOLleu_24271 [Holothuria leucospilota]
MVRFAFLQLNVMKTREIIMDFRKNKANEHTPVAIHGSVVKQVPEYKYLGTRITSNLDWTAQKIIGLELPTIESLYNERIFSKVQNIMKDTTHPLNRHYNFNKSGLRLCIPRSNRARCKQSFVPDSIHLFNSKVSR